MVLTILLYITAFNITSIPSQLSPPFIHTDLPPTHKEYTANCSCFRQPASQITEKFVTSLIYTVDLFHWAIYILI